MDKAIEAAQPKVSEGHALSAQVSDMAQKDAAHTPGKVDAAHTNEQAVKSGALPQLSIQNSTVESTKLQTAAKPAAEHHWWNTALTIGEDLGKGVADEVMHHPGRLAESFAIGAAAAVVATVAIPEVGVAMAVGGAGMAAYGLYKNAGKWLHAAEDLNSPEGKSQAQIEQAHKTIQGVGAGAADIAAGVAGGYAGRAATLAIKGAMARPAVGGESEGETPAPAPENTKAPANPKDTHAIKNSALQSGGNGPNGDHGAAASAAQPQGDAGHAAAAHHAAGTSALNGDPSNGEGTVSSGGLKRAPKLEVPKAEVPNVEMPKAAAAADSGAAAQEQALAASVKNNQGLFHSASGEGSGTGVVESGKQLYNVRFDKVTEDAGRRLFTLENRTEGVVVPKGSYIATRLDASGNPVIEDGITNSWSMQAPKVAKTYNVDMAAVENQTSFVAPTRIDGPSVHMVKLTEPTTITTSWGQMTGKAGDWLANYDYNAATGTPGKDYAIVTAESYRQTYQPKVGV